MNELRAARLTLSAVKRGKYRSGPNLSLCGNDGSLGNICSPISVAMKYVYSTSVTTFNEKKQMNLASVKKRLCRIKWRIPVCKPTAHRRCRIR